MFRPNRLSTIDSRFVRSAVVWAVILSAIVFFPMSCFAERVVDTVAGLQSDDGPALEANLNSPSGVAVDTSGNVYLSDTNNHRIRKLDVAAGQIQTLAGGQSPGYSGDGGPAVSAALNRPRGIAVDASGNVYFADSHNHCIRKIDTSGIITTVAGTGSPGSIGDGRPAASGRMAYPFGIAVDPSGNIYVADLGNHKVRKIDVAGTISTVAGTGVLSRVGDGGPAVDAGLTSPTGVAVDGSGSLFISDSARHVIRKVDPGGPF